jgi:uncharacterized caspase-like protein
MWVRAIFAIALLLLPTALHAQSEKRLALLIGNKDYKAGVGTLTNPLNDIRIVGEALKAVGFEVLKPVENAQRSAMLIAIHAFAAKLKAAGPNAVGFLYYSGVASPLIPWRAHGEAAGWYDHHFRTTGAVLDVLALAGTRLEAALLVSD